MNQERLLQVILSPHVSEKSTVIAEKNNQYVFQVVENATD
ncbi:MAG: 50S ribosomal protein L23, partial [Gammaproteobacteria bacterium]